MIAIHYNQKPITLKKISINTWSILKVTIIYADQNSMQDITINWRLDCCL